MDISYKRQKERQWTDITKDNASKAQMIKASRKGFPSGMQILK